MTAELPRVGYLGPEGTFSEEALLASVADGAVAPWPLASIHDAVMAVHEGVARWAVVPIENSLDGSIVVTLDLLADESSDVAIVAETLLRVRHALIGCEPVAPAEIETVLTHPQVPGQCARFLRAELAQARIMPASSTAEAVRTVVSDGLPRQAAIGTRLAARIYGASVIREGIEDRDDNETRFIWLAHAAAAQVPPLRGGADGEWKTSLVFWGPGAERPGWLVRCLDEFARRDINLTKIESRPRRRRMGAYMFFADVGGRAQDGDLAQAIAGVRAVCEEVRVLGSYRAAPRTAAPDT